MFMDTLSMMVATIPLTYPVVTSLGVDPIWFGIFIVICGDEFSTFFFIVWTWYAFKLHADF
jgi:TRAP-type mannitol/chloroaromatic compound transport system permease large subunit